MAQQRTEIEEMSDVRFTLKHIERVIVHKRIEQCHLAWLEEVAVL
jgi:hypothetical protein